MELIVQARLAQAMSKTHTQTFQQVRGTVTATTAIRGILPSVQRDDLHANPMFGQQWDRAMTTTRFKSPEHQPGFIQICMLDAEFTQEVCSPEL